MSLPRILIIEDSGAMRAFVRASLEEELSAEVFEAAEGLSALAMLSREGFDLVLLDVNIPNLSGLELVAFIRGKSKNRTTPIILMSTESSTRDRQRGLELGANAFLSKPFGFEDLCALVRNTLSASSE